MALLLAGAGVGTMVWWHHSQEAAQSRTETIVTNRHANIFVGAAAEVLQYGGTEALKMFLTRPRKKPFPPVYAVDDAGLDVLDRKLEEAMWQRVRALFQQQSYPEAVRRVVAKDGHSYLLFMVLPERGEEGKGLVAIPTSRRLSHHTPPSLILPIASGLLASLLFSAALAWYFVRPIRSLRNAFAAAAQGNLATRVAHVMGRRHDELAELGRDFDHMAEQLGSLISAQQRLLNDVSHELRSPLARMQAAIGLAQQQPEKMPATLERIDRESQRISDLIGELLLLSRLEAGVEKNANAAIDIGGLLADIAEDACFEAEQKGVELHYHGVGEDVIVETRCELLQRAVENVLRNAVQHCKRGGEVSFTTAFDTASRRLIIAIADQGPGVADADLRSIFQPFFRGSRSKPDSIGLGLTIAQRAVKALGGTIDASNRPLGGLQIKIEIKF